MQINVLVMLACVFLTYDYMWTDRGQFSRDAKCEKNLKRPANPKKCLFQLHTIKRLRCRVPLRARDWVFFSAKP